MYNAVLETNYQFPGQTKVYHGKVRDVYFVDDLLVMIATDRISAFDVVLPRAIPYKGQVLNQIASYFLDATSDIVPNWKINTPDPMATTGYLCKPYPVEMIIRAYLTGSSWRAYQKGARQICGVPLPEGMKEHQRFPQPIITPTTKATEGHDMDISRDEIIQNGLIPEEDYIQIEEYTRLLFERGSMMAAQKGLILVDTKYEFGNKDGEIYLIDEVHTPDSSRYFYAEGYEERFSKGQPQLQLSKEFVREWLMERGFMGQPGQQIPIMDDDFVNSVSERYIELYEKITGEKFIKSPLENIEERIKRNVLQFLTNYKRIHTPK